MTAGDHGNRKASAAHVSSDDAVHRDDDVTALERAAGPDRLDDDTVPRPRPVELEITACSDGTSNRVASREQDNPKCPADGRSISSHEDVAETKAHATGVDLGRRGHRTG